MMGSGMRDANETNPSVAAVTSGALMGRKPSKRNYHRRQSSRAEKKRMITAAKIEFTTEYDKNAFLMMFREVQGLFFPG